MKNKALNIAEDIVLVYEQLKAAGVGTDLEGPQREAYLIALARDIVFEAIDQENVA